MNESGKPAGVPRGANGPASTRRLLLEGTLRCLKEHGLHGTTSRAIAQASGVNLGGITYHFGSKEELVSQALMQATRELIEPAIEILRGQDDPVLRMIGAIQALQSSFERGRDIVPVYVEALLQSRRDDALRAATTGLFHDLRDFLAAQIGDLREQGVLPAWIDPVPMATAIVAMGDGLALRLTVEPDEVDHQELASQVMQLLLAARQSTA
jgi:AcrR family transcriptional regulator